MVKAYTSHATEKIEQEIPALWRFARNLSGKSEDADDLVQETMERALRHMDSYTPGTNLRAWLFTILRHSHINNVRRARQRYEPSEVLETLLPPTKANQDIYLTIQDLDQGLDLLPQEMRDVVIMISLEGLSYEEASKKLGVKVGTVKSRLCRARVALREYMDRGRLH